MTVISRLFSTENRGPEKSSQCLHNEDNIKKKKKKNLWKYGAMLWTGQVPIMRSSKDVNEALISIEGDECFDQRND
jgi:hypothetical protein